MLDIFAAPPPPADARIPYGADPLQFGDLRLPAGPGPHAVVVVAHGGFWRAAYNLDHIGRLCAALTGAGFATWSLEYRRLGQAGGGWPGTLLDVARGADHLRALAGAYPLDLGRVVATGHSAGGHLALWLAARPRIPAGDVLYAPDPLPLRGVVALAPVADLRRAWELHLSRDVVEDFLGGRPDAAPARYATASPAALLPLGLPQTLIHGTADDSVPYGMSVDYQAAARAAGDAVDLVTLPGVGHFELIDPHSAVWPVVEGAIRAHADRRD
jgi:acetyl esterase/lipase